MAKSDLEQQFLAILDQQSQHHGLRLQLPQREVAFLKSRKWRFDFAWPSRKVAVEIDGGGQRGRHATMAGQISDADKHNAAVLAGWKVLRFTGYHFRQPQDVFETVLTALGAFDHV